MNQPAEILEKINAAEERARQIVLKARDKARQDIQTAWEKAAEIIKIGREKADIRYKSVVKKSQLDAEEYATRLAEKNKKERDQLAAVFSSRIGETVQLILKEFKRIYGAC